MEQRFALIGGTGLTALPGLEIVAQHDLISRYGAPSAKISVGVGLGRELLFLPRHGENHSIPPHKINYRANIDLLRQLEVTHIVAVNAVGGIRADLAPASLVLPSQIIDYSWGREHTFHDGPPDPVAHIDFSAPYSEPLRQQLLQAASRGNIKLIEGGVYGVTQGPRLESCAEIVRLERDGCDMVGMTAMPEAALAKEAGIDYVTVAIVANWAAGKQGADLTMGAIEAAIATATGELQQLLTEWLKY
ncbi:S-methyl-5'-thioinosine phosphorylase [Ectothiorhodospiraceae bacterium BW-2]|nr:S-methyl-5'-thioinosine phosphorylase [Ectothiorhodospiraceae bacterium BW-2]